MSARAGYWAHCVRRRRLGRQNMLERCFGGGIVVECRVCLRSQSAFGCLFVLVGLVLTTKCIGRGHRFAHTPILEALRADDDLSRRVFSKGGSVEVQ